MVASVGILAVALLVIMIEVPALLKKNQKKELLIFSIILLCAIGLAMANALQVTIPNPLDAMKLVYKAVHDMVR